VKKQRTPKEEKPANIKGRNKSAATRQTSCQSPSAAAPADNLMSTAAASRHHSKKEQAKKRAGQPLLFTTFDVKN
jgi:hypothetical protein